jgi:hypothetical protein
MINFSLQTRHIWPKLKMNTRKSLRRSPCPGETLKRYIYLYVHVPCKILVGCKFIRSCHNLSKISDGLSLCSVILLPQEAVNLKQKLEKCELHLENTRKSSELSLIPLTSIAEDSSDLVDTTVRELYDLNTWLLLFGATIFTNIKSLVCYTIVFAFLIETS